MTLGFMQHFPWKVNGEPEPTNFREKILAGAGIVSASGILDYDVAKKVFLSRSTYHPKLHTIRADPHNRWKAGRKIGMVYRGKNYSILDHFNKGITELEKCVSVQKIEIQWLTFHFKPLPIMGLNESTTRTPIVNIDGVRFEGACTEIKHLAINDGFDSLESFYRWFKKDFTGSLIHWTDLRY